MCSNFKHTVDVTVDGNPHSHHPSDKKWLPQISFDPVEKLSNFFLGAERWVSVHKAQTTFHISHQMITLFYITTKSAVTAGVRLKYL